MATHQTDRSQNPHPPPAQPQKAPDHRLRSLDEIEGTDLPLVGGKAFRLAVLKQHGFNVPPGLVLTSKFFETQIKHARLVPLWAGSPDIAVTTEALKWLADALKTTPLAPPLAQALNAQVSRVFDPQVSSFAVRSSAIDEDQRDHSFAGLHLTELGVPRGALYIAITRCWASALYGPAIQYRQAHGMSIQSIRTAVLIQPMLSPESSGVGFTINPLTGARDELVIEATWGLGNRLVAGQVQPHFYRLANQPPDYPLIEKRAGSDEPPTGESPLAKNGPISPQEAAELARQLGQVQALMGQAQDVEWAFEDNTFFLLQTRPVATGPKTAQSGEREWTRGGYAEALPELPSPFFGSLLARSQNQISLFFKALGLEIENRGPFEKIILGRPYLNLTFLKRMLVQVGLNPDSVLQATGHTKMAAPETAFSVDWRAAWQARAIYWAGLRQILGLRLQLKKSLGLLEQLVGTLAAPAPNAPRDALLNQLRRQEQIFSLLSTANLRLGLAIGAITGLGSRLLAPVSKAPANTIRVLALRELKSEQVELNQALVRLSRLAHDDAQTKQALLNLPERAGNLEPHNLDVSPEFQQNFNELLARYGHRASYEVDPGWPRYRDDPTPLLRILQQAVKNPPQALNEPAATWPTLTEPPTGINRLLPWRRAVVGLLVNLLRRYFLLRNRLDSAKARAVAACRAWNLALAEKWVSQGWLAQPDDIFWLTLEEIEQAIMQEDNTAITVSAAVQARKETYQGYAQTEMPFNLKESQLPFVQLGVGLSPRPVSDVIVGLPISPGQTRGTVRVVRHPDELENLTGDDLILVMPSTDPVWLSRLHLAAGLIVETGGLLSHGSVIAREYGLPTVANIPQATQQFHTGDKVLVDGSTGVVQLLEAASTG